MDKRDGERSDAAIFGYEGDESKKQHTDWHVQEIHSHSQMFIQFILTIYRAYKLCDPGEERQAEKFNGTASIVVLYVNG